MISYSKASFITLCVAAALLLPAAGASVEKLQPATPQHYPAVIRLDELIAIAEDIARADASRRQEQPGPLPAYLEALLADGRLSIGLGIGTKDLGEVRIPPELAQQVVRRRMRICGRPVVVESRFVLSRADFSQALAECEILFVTSHSRFGAGPVFLNDGKALPFLMQQKKGYEIIMPDSEVCGYEGKIKRQFYSPKKGTGYTVFEPDGSDLEKARPLHGFQLLALSTCTSKKHFRDEIKSFRSIYPTAAILTTQAACLDTGMNIFMRLLAEVFQGRQLPDVVSAMNKEYRQVATQQVRKGATGWKLVDNMYTLGINTLP